MIYQKSMGGDLRCLIQAHEGHAVTLCFIAPLQAAWFVNWSLHIWAVFTGQHLMHALGRFTSPDCLFLIRGGKIRIVLYAQAVL